MQQPRHALYIHFPFCERRCNYCDFATEAVAYEKIPREAYTGAVLRELELRVGAPLPLGVVTPAQTLPPEGAPLPLTPSPHDAGWGDRSGGVVPFTSVFFGGGTPSLWGAEYVARVLDAVRARVGLAAGCEVTLEANPRRVAMGLPLDAYREAGVTRLSMGVQSFSDGQLKVLSRNHDAATAREAIAAVRGAGFESFSIDLIFATPGQTQAMLEDDVGAVLGENPPHVSLYQLTYEAGTALTHMRDAGMVAAADDETAATMYATIHERLTGAGYRHYEVSNLAKPGHEARHNLAYWRMTPYMALGVGAHGDDGGERYANTKVTGEYLAALSRGELGEVFRERPTAEERLTERLMLGLRVAEGISLAELRTRAELVSRETWPALRDELNVLAGDGLLEMSGEVDAGDGRVAPTFAGMNVLDAVVKRLFGVVGAAGGG